MTKSIANVPNDITDPVQLDNTLSVIIAQINKLSGFNAKPLGVPGLSIAIDKPTQEILLLRYVAGNLTDTDLALKTISNKVDELIRSLRA